MNTKKWLMALAIGWELVLGVHAQQPQTGSVRLYCNSVRFSSGTGAGLYTLDLTTLSTGVNGELRRDWLGILPYSSSLILRSAGEPVFGSLKMSIPASADANGNGWSDFFETSMTVNANSSGVYQLTGLLEANLSATWTRPAGSRYGTCVLHLQSFGTFTHTFEILEYTGTLSYYPGDSLVLGSFHLWMIGRPEFTLIGPLVATKSDAMPFDELILPGNSWTNQTKAVLSFGQDILSRDTDYPTNYYGIITFQDGDPASTAPDYCDWVLSIDDSNDHDGDNVPDFSDAPGLPSTSPLLSLRLNGSGLDLEITGNIGRDYTIEETADVLTGSWTKTTTLTLTSAIVHVQLPISSSSSGGKFWRAASVK